MIEQPLDLRNSLRIAWRHRLVVTIFAAVGLLGGAVYSVIEPPTVASTALVVLPATIQDTSTQMLIVDSDPVVTAAVQSANLSVSVQKLRSQVSVSSPTTNVLSITVHGTTAAEAQAAANAVATSYVHYVDAPHAPGGSTSAAVLQPASSASGTALPIYLAITALLGAVIGCLLGIGVALWIGRGDKRLRTRDEIADSIGFPVLASMPVDRPASAAGWAKLLTEYDPAVVDGWRLRKTLYDLGLADVGDERSTPVAPKVLNVLSVSHDQGALALGPQVAVFAARLGIPTRLVVGAQQGSDYAAALRAACEAPLGESAKRPGNLLVAADTAVLADGQPGIALAVVVDVVDAAGPEAKSPARPDVTVLGVSAGVLTADELARVAVSCADGGRKIAGMLVADPDPADRTTGRMPQLTPRKQRSMPTRLTGTTARTRR
jgi:capsular polysaccharide biosynthesis protein